MAVDDRLSDLLVEWEQGRRSGQEPSLEELCRDTPDLLPVVRESIDSLKATDWMFGPEPSDLSSAEASIADSHRAALHDTELPASHLTVQEFAASIFQSGLLSRPEIDELKARLDASALPGEAREIASKLVTEGKLTRYQAAVLLKASKDPLLVDNYVILDTLDTGGMGLVFKALHRSMNRVVALKLLPASMMSARDTVKRFQREVQAAAALKHPNIVAAYDADESEEIAYLVLEYVEGTNLFRLVKEHGPCSLARAADYVRQAATGLAYLHSRGIIHRDVKPANLILANDGTVKLLDMGLVRFASSEDLSCAEMDQELTQAGIVIGTVAYMSPEQALDTRSADQRSDIYSLGCTLFFLLTGRSLYHEETGMKTLLAHREQPVPSIRAFCEEAPVSLDAVFRTMVAKRPADRLQTMEEIIAAIDACVPGPAPAADRSARPMPSSPPLLTAIRRNRAWQSRRFRVGAAVTALAAAVIVSVYLAVILIRIKTSQGTTEVSVNDPTAKIEILSQPEGRTEENRSLTSGTRREPAKWSKVEVRKRGAGHAAEGSQITAGPGASSPPPEPVEQDVVARMAKESSDDRAIAQWVHAYHGEFAIVEQGRLKRIRRDEAIPKDGFHLLRIIVSDRPNEMDHLPAPPLGNKRVPLPEAVASRLAGLTDLTMLRMNCRECTDATLKAVGTLRGLVDLGLRHASITDAGLQWLSELKHLRALDLRDTSIADKGLQELAKIKLFANVHDEPPAKPWTRQERPILWLDGTQTTEAGIIAFQRLVPNCEISAAHVMGVREDAVPYRYMPAPFPPAPGSTDRTWAEWLLAHLNDCSIRTDVDPETVVTMAKSLPPIDFHITRIGFSGQAVSEGANWVHLNALILRRLNDLTALEAISFNPPSDTWIPAVTTLTRLKSLSLQSANDIGDEALKAIGGMTNLKSLRIESNRLTDDSLKLLASLHELGTLQLIGARYLRGNSLKDLSGLKNLKVLSLADSAIDDAALAHVAQFSMLADLNLSGTWISGNGLSQLVRLTHLKELDLSRCRRIDNEAVAPLMKLDELRGLNLNDTRVTADVVPELRERFPNCRIIWPAQAQSDAQMRAFESQQRKQKQPK